MKHLKETLLGGLVAFTLSSAAFAVETRDGAKVFNPDYFEQYAPRTALDMVSRIPGFQLQESDDKRGLGQGGANVLINGERISGKTNPREQLSRINAKNVVRVEIVDGTSLDIPGLSGQVANVITKTTGVSGTWEWYPEFRPKLAPRWWSGEVTISGETGKLSYSAKLQNDAFRNGHRGPENLFTPDGTIFETRYEDGQYYGDNPGGSVDLTWKPKQDHVGNLSAAFYQFNFNARETSKRTALTPRGVTQETLFNRSEDEWNAEFAGDYEFPVGPGKLKFIGYYQAEHSPTISRFDVFHPSRGLTDSSQFFQTADESETIGRTEYSWSPANGRDWQFGVEGVFNVLDIDSQFVERNVTPDNPNNARVEEKRAEATLTHSRKLSPKWDVQVSAGVEYSQLSQVDTPDITLPSGPAIIREFVRPKGFISATYKPDDRFTIRAKLEREVGQLDFFDFISSVSVQDDFDQAGNNDLVPSQSWTGELEFDKNFGQGNTLKAKFYGELISDLVDRIPVGIDGDAVGNISTGAQRYGVELSSTIKGDRWGIKGAQLELSLTLQDSSVDDPLTGIARRISGDTLTEWEIEFRHDIPKTDWAYGFGANRNDRTPVFRLSTINQFTFPVPFSYAFIEHKDIFGLKVRVFALNLFDSTDDFKRQIFTDRRDIGVLDFTEQRTRDFGLFGRLVVSGTF